MPAFQSTFEELTQSWQLRLQDAETGEPDLLARVETCIRICEESLLQLRQWVMERSFPGKQCADHTPLNCTASRTDVVELGYALHTTGFFNNGKASIKDILNLLSDMLQINLRNYPHTFFQIRERKINPTKFIDELKTGLIR